MGLCAKAPENSSTGDLKHGADSSGRKKVDTVLCLALTTGRMQGNCWE